MSFLCLDLGQDDPQLSQICSLTHGADRHLVNTVTSSEMYCNSTYFLRMGQSFMKWPILPQMRQQRSLGATSPSVRTSGSKKYSYGRWKQITFSMLNNSTRICINVAVNTDHLTGVHRRKGFDWCAKHCSAIDESLHDEVSHCLMTKETWEDKKIHLKRKEKKTAAQQQRDNRRQIKTDKIT